MPKWRNKIDIKKELSRDSNDESVLKVVTMLIPQLKRVERAESMRLKNGTSLPAIKKENLEYYHERLTEIIEEFIWIKESIEKKEDASEFSYENWCEAFNNYLTELFDLGDSVVTFRTHFDQEKYLWVG